MATVHGPRRAQSSPLDVKTYSSDRPHPEDAAVLLPTAIPPPVDSKADDIWRVGKYVFRADFDSANLASVEQGLVANEFLLQTRRDCGGTENEKTTRTWFYFSIAGHNTGDLIILIILNLNKQSRLYSQDYRPVFWCASQPEWQPLKLRVTYRREGDDFQLRFCHRFESEEETLFAFAIPFSYQETQAGWRLLFAEGPCFLMQLPDGTIPRPYIVSWVPTQEMLDHLDKQLPFPQNGTISCNAADARDAAETSFRPNDAGTLNSASPSQIVHSASPISTHAGAGAAAGARARCTSEACSSSSGGGDSSPGARLYYRRQLLTRSLEGRRVEVLTITDCSGASGEVEPPLPGVFEHDPGPPAAMFRDKTVFFVSSRVHPGETPATHMFNGMLAFLLRRSDPRASALRRRFVFKLVPIVNPDGVAVGNYRTDTLGQNLNRFYTGIPDEKTQPSVYAIKTLLMYYAQQNVLEFYIDLHGHANKKGVFIYGNTLEDCDAHMQSLLYSKLVALNNPCFDFMGCNYTEKNMVRADKDGASKEGAGRVALYRETGLTHLYTIEANYNTARTLNVVAPASGDHGGRASPPCNKRFPSKFTVGAFHGVGRAILIAALDLEGNNPWSRLPLSEHRSLEGVRSWILTVLRATPETRAAHLPAMSDVAVEKLRAMIASGTLRISPAYTSTRRQSNTNANGRNRLPPAPMPSRHANASLPVITSHGSAPTSAANPSGVAPRRSAVPLGRTSNDGLARSTSLPVKISTSSVLQSPLHSVGSTLGIRDAAAESVQDGEDVDIAAAVAAVAASDAACAVTEGPSDSDGEEEHEEIATRTASPGSSSSAASALSRFRSVESTLRSPTTSFKTAAVYCGRVTEFKFPLSDIVTGPPAEVSPRISAGVLGYVNAAVRHRPPSAGSSGRPSSSGGVLASSVATPVVNPVLGANGAVGSRHLSIPRSAGSTGAILITPDQLAPTNTTKKKSTSLSFAISSSRRNR
ncbi:hypothetical protein VOLCADRAFT_105933 [Volvox carteri f. nagariensis]|uniref:Cytosolic carboxypeptidase-like protein 5 n=1 Tax=Volvox carteri f. nagariensis TaxID=3068 RepID=D8U4C5_VOLCA|nr:uncharacterized protein VOLCADRAFT_105933 [Volvox carteri f. nagariensis]EFJ45477.1 hypothetical protein VOLCADRAFT_105933 [Volvox carteri f. nagariensis]|eukprot:XP_002953504.1 hypothetical protein VOLCADRAFT_105933 [Volvox carteri f. nagariensis]